MKVNIRKVSTIAVAGALLLGACGDDDSTDESTDETVESDDTVESEGDGSETIEITAVDYAFEGVPETISAGSTLTLTNESTAEVHELVALRIPDDETRSIEEIAQLPDSEIEEIFPEEPAAVIIAPPGDDGFPAFGDGAISEPGRYALVCFVPLGADPDEFLDLANQTDEGPDVEGGPPHVEEGMFAEITVE